MERVLIVSDRRPVVEAVGAALERRGLEVLVCPGPQPPDHQCVATRGGRCPLERSADVVLLDLDMECDDSDGVPSWILLRYYVDHGLPVIALEASGEQHELASTDADVVLPSDARTRDIVNAVMTRLGSRTRGPEPCPAEPAAGAS